MKLNTGLRRATALGTALSITLVTAWAVASVVDPAVFFDHVAPFSGNPVKCSGTDGSGTYSLGYDNVLALDGYPSGTYTFTVQGSTQSVTVTQTSGGIDWTSTYPIQAVIMKGSDKANVYPYVLPPNAGNAPVSGVTDWNARTYTGSLTADTDLNFPSGSSHVEFCYDNDEPIVRPPDISKTAVPSWVRYHDWTLDKSVDPASIEMFDGDTHDADYTITTTKDPWGNFTVSGVIELSDPLGQGFTVNSVADSMVFADDPASTVFHPTLNCGAVSDGDVFYRCTYSMTLSSKIHTFLAAGGTGVNTAVADVSLNGVSVLTNPGQATANFAFPADPASSFGDELVVDDTMVAGAPDHTFTDAGSWGYPHTFSCPDDDGDNPNTATGTYSTGPSTSGTASDSANVAVDCHVVTVQKTAYTRFTRDYDWTPDKKIVVRPEDLTVEDKTTHCSLLASGPYVGNYLCDDITIKLPTGGVYDTVYALKATKDAGSDSARQVYGTIQVSWDADVPDPVFSGDPTDVLSFLSGSPTTINGVVSGCTAGSDQINCDYVADVPDLRSGTNTASVDRPHVCYNADGTTKACAAPGSSTYTGQAPFSFGAPTTKVDDCVALSDLFNGTAGLNLGPTFDWTVLDPVCASNTSYVTGEVTPGNFLDIHADWAPAGFENYTPACTFYVPNVLNLHADDGVDESDEATIGVYVADACNTGCTLTQGYWKTHAIYAPKPQFAKKRDATWDMVGGENASFFGSGYTWINVFWTAPKGNAYYLLAHQYMAARLNQLDGASTPASVATAMANASAWFTAHPSPTDPWWKSNKNTVTTTAGLLASYNEGKVGPGHCSEGPLRTGLIAQ